MCCQLYKTFIVVVHIILMYGWPLTINLWKYPNFDQIRQFHWTANSIIDIIFKLLVNSTNHVDINRPSTTHLMHHQITMEFSLLLSLQILIPTLIFLTLIITKKRNGKLPPGPRRIPLLGNMHNMISSEAPHRALHKLSQKFGPVMHLQLGEVSVAVISSPEAAKQV